MLQPVHDHNLATNCIVSHRPRDTHWLHRKSTKLHKQPHTHLDNIDEHKSANIFSHPHRALKEAHISHVVRRSSTPGSNLACFLVCVRCWPPSKSKEVYLLEKIPISNISVLLVWRKCVACDPKCNINIVATRL